MSDKFEFQHRTKPDGQVKYSSWQDPNAPKQYWNDVESLAYFIGKALDGRLYAFDHHERSFSTIRVLQTKEKFGDPRVYCRLADAELVTRAYEKSSKFEPGEVPHSFKIYRVIEDAKLYRSVYQRLMKLVPQYYVIIRNGADYPGLICETKEELDELLASPFYAGTALDAEDPEQLKALYELCGFTSG